MLRIGDVADGRELPCGRSPDGDVGVRDGTGISARGKDADSPDFFLATFLLGQRYLLASRRNGPSRAVGAPWLTPVHLPGESPWSPCRSTSRPSGSRNGVGPSFARDSRGRRVFEIGHTRTMNHCPDVMSSSLPFFIDISRPNEPMAALWLSPPRALLAAARLFFSIASYFRTEDIEFFFLCCFFFFFTYFLC